MVSILRPILMLLVVSCIGLPYTATRSIGSKGIPLPSTSRAEFAGWQNPAPDKWALLIGINKYRYSITAGYRNAVFKDLQGCLNDVEDVRRLLTDMFEFPGNHIATLKNQEATREGILTAIRTELIDKAKPGDIVVLYFSGHGSYQEDPANRDHLEGTIVPQDSRDPAGQVFDIKGKELSDLLKEVRTRNVTFFFDSCHSGNLLEPDGTRGPSGVRGIPPDTRRQRTVKRRRSAARLKQIYRERGVGMRPPDATFALLAGSTSREKSNEQPFQRDWRGAMTYFFTREVRRLGKDVTYRDVMDNVRGLVNSIFPRQHPQLEGALADQYVFADRDSVTQHYVLASPAAAATTVSFEGGRVLNMTVGSTYDVYNPRTKTFAPPEQPVARVEVTRVDDFTAEGRIFSGSHIEPNSRAVEREHLYEDFKVLVHYKTPLSQTVQTVKTRLDAKAHIEATAEPNACDLQVAESVNKLIVRGCTLDVTPRPIPLGSTVTSRAAAVETAVRQIEHWAKWLNLMKLNNTQAALKVEFEVRPVPPGSTAAQPESGTAELGALFYDDHKVLCTIKNNSGRDLFISLLDFASDGSVQVFYPAPRQPSKLIAAGDSDAITVPLEELSGRTTDFDVFKLFATSKQRDFSVFEQDAVTSDNGTTRLIDDPLGRLFRQAGFGERQAITRIPAQDWVTVQRMFEIHSSRTRR
jgi:hypothetical protein